LWNVPAADASRSIKFQATLHNRALSGIDVGGPLPVIGQSPPPHYRNQAERLIEWSNAKPTQPNHLWCADYKGEFMLADKRYCYPLTISDFASRYLLSCEALSTTQEIYAFTVFERVFKQFGLRKLAVWWLRLGIQIERIKPAIRNRMAAMNAFT